jgi:hypothetical protein
MNDPSVTILFDGDGRAYAPGEVLAGEYRLEAVAPASVKSVEVSVLWYTEGKGDEDMAVHEFWRLNTDDGDWIDPRRPARFSTTLPNSPLSYDGMILKICWCVRVRVFFHRGKDLVGQKAFQLGGVPAVEVSEP